MTRTVSTNVPFRDRPVAAPDAFDALVGDIYECVLDATRWPAMLSRVCAAIGGTAGWVAVHVPNRVTSTYQIETGTDPAWQRRLREDYVGSSPFVGMAHYVRPGDVLSVGDVIDYDEFVAGRFYREWAAPQGWPDLIFAVLSRDADRFSFLGVCLPERATADNKRVAARLLPHVDRALRILDLIGRKDRDVADLSSAIGAMATGVILLDRAAAVRAINPAAERLLAGIPGFSLLGGTMRPSTSRIAEQVRRLVESCAEGTMAHEGATVLVEGGDRPLTVHVVPLPGSRAVTDGRAVAALFVSDPDRPASIPVESVVERYGLTPSEMRVALALLDGKTPRAIAATHGVALATVRTHLRRLYEKTGVSGQATLVRLIGTATRAV